MFATRDKREFNVQLRAFDAARQGQARVFADSARARKFCSAILPLSRNGAGVG